VSDTRNRMQDVARSVASILPPGSGFVVLAFDFDKPGKGPTGRLDYVSNAQRPDICRAMIEFIQKTVSSFGEHELERLLTRQVELTEEECRLVRWALENGGVGAEHATLEKFK
jgi:hypothetical protein